MKRVVVSVCLLLAALQFGHAQNQKADSIRLEKALDKAYLAEDSAAHFFALAEKEMTSPFWKARYQNTLGVWLTNHELWDSAIYHYQILIDDLKPMGESDAYYLEMASALNNFSNISEPELGRTGVIEVKKRAFKLLEDHQIKDPIGARILIEIGVNHWYLENYSIGLDWWQTAMTYASENDYETAIMDASANLAMAYQHQRKLTLSLEYYKLHLNRIKQIIKWNAGPYVLDMKSIGLLYSEIGNLDSATFYFEEGLRIIETGAVDEYRQGLGPYLRNLILNNLANVQMRQKHFKKAELSFLDVLAYNEATYGKNSRHLIRTYLGLGDLHRRTKEFDLCEQYYQHALDLAQANDFNEHSCHNRLGLLFEIMNEYDKSIAHYDSAIAVTSKTYNNDQLAYVNPAYLLNALMGKAKVENSRAEIDIEKIESIYAQLRDVIHFFQKNTDSHRIFSYIPKVLGHLYEAYSKTYDQTGNELWLERLWEVSELNKASKLRNQLKANYSLTYAIPKTLIEKEKSLKDSINQLISKLKPGGFDSSLFVLKRKHEGFLSEMEQRYPKYHALKNSNNFISLSAKQASLQPGELLYNFLEGDSVVFMMRIGTHDIQKVTLNKQEFSRWIGDHNNAIFNTLDDQLNEASIKLTEALLLSPKDLKGVKRLIIVPDGMAWNLNFAGLGYKTENASEFLGNKMMISFDHFSSESNLFQKSTSKEVLAFSFNEESDAEVLTERTALRNLNSSLPGTSLEVTSISKQWKGDYFFAKGANETNFKQEVGNYGILHLAIHGYQDEVNPENSYLKFAAADSLNDGKLHAYEVYNLNLNADLAVLTACYSGQGTFVAGEGMVSLGKAFSYAGVKSVLISRWEVSDYSAPFLMQYFYSGLKEGMRKSEALKYAQTMYLENHSDALTASPFYWSSFYILGDDSPIYKSAVINPWMLLWLAVVLLSTQIFLRKGKANL